MKLVLCAGIAFARVVTACFRTVTAIAHRTPTPVLRTTLIHEKPTATPIVLTLLYLVRM
jgi:hypothetical protein